MELEKLSPALLRRAELKAMARGKESYQRRLRIGRGSEKGDLGRELARGGKADLQATLFGWGRGRNVPGVGTQVRASLGRLREHRGKWRVNKRRLVRVKRESPVDRLHREVAEAAERLRRRDKMDAAQRRRMEALGSDYGYSPARAYR